MRSLKVKEYMATKLVTFAPDLNVVEAMNQILNSGITAAPVVDESGSLVGILSEVDLMPVVIQDSYYDEPLGIVSDYMKTPVDTVDPNLDIYTLAERFIHEHRRRYPVVDAGKLVGQVSRRDVLRAALDYRDK
ncbi:MAG: CBS domain-containing protein [Gammaproteobacteria bacterium]|nr:CBS domain-containing protein [Gammaproteobacteria bacterium]